MNYFRYLAAGFVCLFCFQFKNTNAQWEKVFYDKQYFKERRVDPALKSKFVEHSGSADWDLTFNQLELAVDPAKQYIDGKVSFVFKSLKDNLQNVTIDLHNQLHVGSIESNGIQCQYTHENGLIVVSLPGTLKKNETGSFIVSYSGKPTSGGLGSFTKELHNNIPSVYTLSEPYGAKEWWPCKESLSDKIDSVVIKIETPSKYRSASNGLLVSDVVSNGKRICTWKHGYPIANYLIFFSSTQYEVYSEWATLEDNTKVEILNYIYPETLETAKLNTPFTKDYLEFFSRKFIDYPFKKEKYGHAQFGWGGGMEHQTMSSMGLFAPDLISHELAHQWFGDYITCGNWNEIWLNEGFATYLAALVYEEFDPEMWDLWKLSDLYYICSSPGGSVYVNDITDINGLFDSRLVYEKAAYVLHMLRGQLGDDHFFEGMRRYLTDTRVINGFATTDLFRDNMELVSDTTLTEFFNDWIWGEGFPYYNIKWKYAEGQLAIDVYQQPSIPNGPFFEMNLPITITVNGNEETIWLPNNKQGQHYSFPLTEAPTSVLFNKDNWILAKEKDFNTNSSSFNSSQVSLLYNSAENYLVTTIPDTEEAKYTIFDLQGRTVAKGTWHKSNPVIPLNMVGKGTYIITFLTKQQMYNLKFNR